MYKTQIQIRPSVNEHIQNPVYCGINNTSGEWKITNMFSVVHMLLSISVCLASCNNKTIKTMTLIMKGILKCW